jgi:hypothetical protein
MASVTIANPISIATHKPLESGLLTGFALLSCRDGTGRLAEVLGAGKLLIGTFLA